MGHLFYDGHGGSILADDRLLAHLQVVIVAKLRRHEGFTLSWVSDHGGSDGRSTIWLHPGATLRFHYAGGRAPRINTAWISALATSAEQPGGLHLVPEPAEATVPSRDSPARPEPERRVAPSRAVHGTARASRSIARASSLD